MKYSYPEYEVDLTPKMLAECRDIGQRILEEIGLRVRHEKFVSAIKGHDGVKVIEDRVYLGRTLTDPYYDEYIADNLKRLLAAWEREVMAPRLRAFRPEPG